jgi:hypothetical protein
MADVPVGSESASRLETLVARVASGESIAEIRRGMVPGSWAPALRRVAVVGRFDQGVYDGLLAVSGSSNSPALDTLADAGLIVPVPGRPGWFSMSADDRAIWSAELDDGELRTLENALGQAQLSRGDRLEALPHLLNGDPAQGIELLKSLLAEADAQLNLPRWQDILRVAEDNTSSTGADLADFIAAHTAYLNARSMCLTDYYQSALFLEPPGFREKGLEFASGHGPPVWHIVGPGGTGKTMQLRWLVSRLWVPQPARIPCARVDFDTVAPAMCARYPFLVFIMAADQLGRQLPHNPFSRLLRAYEPWLRSADRQGGEDALPTAQTAHAVREVPRMFANACRTAGDTPIVVILDTLEELSLRYPTETATLIGQFREVLRSVHGLRLVFSGRYEIPAVGQIFAGIRPQLVTPFSPDRSRAYLGEIRGITGAARQDELIQRAGGLPYVLAMYADLITADPAVTLDDIGLDLEPRLVYLAERIIDRIPEPLVRWLLRYGWAPRRLTRAYVRDVLAPFVIQASSGDRALDNPMVDPITDWLGRPLFPADLPDLQAELDRAWEALKTYASDSSWVTGVPGDPDAVLLKAEMLAPMRTVLAGRPVVRELHLQSAEFYRARAGTDPGSRSRWLGEVIYHLAQAASPDLVSRWQEFADQVREAGDYRALADLSAEIVTPAYAGGELLSRSLRIEAHLWRAYAAQALAVRLLQEGPYNGWRDNPLWADVRREHEAATRLAGNASAAGSAFQPSGRHGLLTRAERLVRAALALYDADLRAAWELTDELIDASGDLGICALALRVAVASQASQDATEPLERLTGQELNARRPAAAADSAGVLAARLASAGRIDRALSVVSQVSVATGQLAGTRLALLIEQGTPAAARDELDPPDLSPEQALVVGFRRVEALLALRQPERALTLLQDCEARIGQLRDTASQLRERALFLELTGITHGAMLRLDEAAAAFERSASLWLELGHPDGHLRSRRHHADVLLHEVGDVSEALTLLNGLSAQLDDREESAAVLRLTVQALVQWGQPAPAADIAERLLLRSEQGAEPLHRDRVLAAIAALTATRDIRRFGPPLLSSLRHIRPGTARLRLLEQLQWCPVFPGDPLMRDVLSEAAAADPAASREDLAVHDLQRAYVARAAADPRLDTWLTSALDLAGPSYLACEILKCFPDRVPEDALLLAQQYLSSLSFASGTLAAMVHLRQARAERLSPEEMSRLLRRAEGELEAAGRPSRWLAECYQLCGSLALDQADWDEAARQLQSARILQERLGNALAVRVLDDQRGSDLTQPAAASAHARETVVRDLPRRRSGTSPDLDAMAAAIARAGLDDRYPESAVVRVESPELEVMWPPWELVANRVYRAQPPAGSLRRDVAWLRWVLDTWRESLSPDLREDCRRVVEGQDRLTPLLREQVESAARSPGGSPRVLIVKSSEEAEASWRYSHQARGLNLRRSYLSAGWDVEELTAGEAREGAEHGRLLARRPVDVIHLTARMETSGTLSWFDTSEENITVRSSAKGLGVDTGIFATEVIGWLAEMSRGHRRVPPVVVLDPVAAPYLAVDSDLLAGRNRFAASVYLDGMAMAVVATGLVGRDPLASQQAWLDGVARRAALEEVVRDLRQVADPAAPPALFAPSRTFTISVA